MNIPAELKYTKDHEWVKIDGDIATVGITDFAQSELGDIVYVEVDTLDESLEKDAVFGTVEAVKTVSDLFLPLSGEVIEFNEGLEDTVKFQERLNNSKGVSAFGFLSDISKAIPGMSSLTSMFDDASEAARDTQFAMEKQRELDIAALKSGKGVTKDMTDRLGITDKINFTKKGTANQKDLKGKIKSNNIHSSVIESEKIFLSTYRWTMRCDYFCFFSHFFYS